MLYDSNIHKDPGMDHQHVNIQYRIILPCFRGVFLGIWNERYMSSKIGERQGSRAGLEPLLTRACFNILIRKKRLSIFRTFCSI